jgi:amino acid transporter
METLRRFVSGLVIGILVLASIGLGLYGADHLTQATLGVGVVCVGVLVAVIARIAQAADHHAELRRIFERNKSQV